MHVAAPEEKGNRKKENIIKIYIKCCRTAVEEILVDLNSSWDVNKLQAESVRHVTLGPSAG